MIFLFIILAFQSFVIASIAYLHSKHLKNFKNNKLYTDNRIHSLTNYISQLENKIDETNRGINGKIKTLHNYEQSLGLFQKDLAKSRQLIEEFEVRVDLLASKDDLKEAIAELKIQTKKEKEERWKSLSTAFSRQ